MAGIRNEVMQYAAEVKSYWEAQNLSRDDVFEQVDAHLESAFAGDVSDLLIESVTDELFGFSKHK